MKLKRLHPSPQRKWLVAHFTQVAIQVEGVGLLDEGVIGEESDEETIGQPGFARKVRIRGSDAHPRSRRDSSPFREANSEDSQVRVSS